MKNNDKYFNILKRVIFLFVLKFPILIKFNIYVDRGYYRNKQSSQEAHID